ncbi:MAG TPA: hypothetical protein VFM18_18830 [Methanosarcina sp.]|nr:hypothetical protein [Methanosarcina sp.]
MYSFAPIADMSDVHTGFYFILGCGIIAMLGVIASVLDDGISIDSLLLTGGICFFVWLAHYNSYTPEHPLNQQVVGTFVAFQPEGYNELSGKTRADHHYMYVIYSVNGQNVILQAYQGVTYPQFTTLYKN